MRTAWLALFCFGAAAFSQSPAPKKIDPDKLFQLPDQYAHPAPEFQMLKRLPPMKNELILPRPAIVSPPRNLNNRQIDPKIILHPPWHGLSKGKDFAHHLYPDLKFLPLRRARPVR